ncbi:MAG: DUF86 domain-containing protein [Nitrospira sp.]|jgi:uncharacterized protein with HEPN domain|nr:MAG: DUF86 domain-containing protein [Nitrospira sp.]
MPRDYKVYVDDILEAIAKIKRFTAGFDSETFSADEKTFDAVIRNLEVIGEAVKKIPEEFRNQYPAVEWKKIAGVRDMLIHEYFGIDVEIVWDIIQNKLPILESQIAKIIAES